MANQAPIRRHRESGQALVMVSVSLVAMIMILAFAVDLGWAFYVRKSAQAAADAAALAAVKAVDSFAISDPTKRWTCGGGAATCTPPGGVACPGAGGNLAQACLMAAQNKFTNATNWETITVEASDSTTRPPTVNHDCGRDEDGNPEFINHPPDLHGVDTFYWVRVTVSHNVPVLFSAIFGDSQSLVRTRATAAAVRAEVIGSLILLNRGETWNSGGQDLTGVNLYLSGMGNSYVRVPGGIVLSSTTLNSGVRRSGWIKGGGEVTGLETSPDDLTTYLRNDGDGNIGGIDAPDGQWHGATAYRPDGRMFEDPFQDKGQPPISPSTTRYWPVVETKNGVSGVLDSTNPACSGGICQPGNYYAVKASADGNSYYPTGDPIEINSSLNFRNGMLGPTDQKDFVFFGGVQMNSGGKGNTVVDFGSGRYVMAGVKSSGADVFATANGVTLTGGTGEGSDPGRLVVLTDTSYNGLDAASRSCRRWHRHVRRKSSYRQYAGATVRLDQSPGRRQRAIEDRNVWPRPPAGRCEPSGIRAGSDLAGQEQQHHRPPRAVTQLDYVRQSADHLGRLDLSAARRLGHHPWRR